MVVSISFIVSLLSSLERAGVMLRLDKKLLPTRNRLATLSTAELDKLSELKNIIRNRLVHLDVEDQVEELLRQLSYSIKNQLVASKAPDFVHGNHLSLCHKEQARSNQNTPPFLCIL